MKKRIDIITDRILEKFLTFAFDVDTMLVNETDETVNELSAFLHKAGLDALAQHIRITKTCMRLEREAAEYMKRNPDAKLYCPTCKCECDLGDEHNKSVERKRKL